MSSFLQEHKNIIYPISANLVISAGVWYMLNRKINKHSEMVHEVVYELASELKTTKEELEKMKQKATDPTSSLSKEIKLLNKELTLCKKKLDMLTQDLNKTIKETKRKVETPASSPSVFKNLEKQLNMFTEMGKASVIDMISFGPTEQPLEYSQTRIQEVPDEDPKSIIEDVSGDVSNEEEDESNINDDSSEMLDRELEEEFESLNIKK